MKRCSGRFDDVIHYSAPNAEMCEALIRNRLSPFDVRALGWKKIQHLAQGLSHGDIVKACEGRSQRSCSRREAESHNRSTRNCTRGRESVAETMGREWERVDTSC